MNTRVTHTVLVIIVFAITPLWANMIRVPGIQPTIQSGINAATNGDTVVVSPGVYYENIFFRGKNIVVTSRFYETGDLNFIQSTVINGSQPLHSDTASCVLIINHEDSTAVLQGFTITGGKGTKWLDEHGAGTYREGGGILIAFSAPTVRYNLIMNNEAANTSGVSSAGGGGIRAGDGNPKILNNFITTNNGRYGAGIVLNFTGTVMKNNVLANNYGGQDFGGGGLWMNGNGSSPLIIENNTIAKNKTVAVYIWGGTSLMRNNIIWADSTVSAAQIAVRSGGPAVTYSLVLGGRSGTGNINNNPQFADSAFHLGNTSLCIDGGDTSSKYNDRENNVSPGNAWSPSHGTLRNDMGAYGGPGAAELPNVSLSTGVSSSGSFRPSGFRLEQNYPNPFNPSTTISYTIPERSFVSLTMYDVSGRKIASLVNDNRDAGQYQIQFNGNSLSSGIYFFRLQTNELIDVKKSILLK
jgi:hypothetical protein